MSALAAPERTAAGGSATALLVLNGTLLAGAYGFAKTGVAAGLSPLSILTWQVVFAAAVVTLAAWARGERPLRRPLHLRYAAWAGLLGVTLPNLATFAALRHVPAGVIGVVAALSPAFTYVLAVLLRVERVRCLQLAGLSLGLAGVWTIVLPGTDVARNDFVAWTLVATAAPLLLAGGNLYRSLAWPAGLGPLAAASRVLVLQGFLLVPLAVSAGQVRLPGLDLEDSTIALAGAGLLTAGFYLGAFELQRRAGPMVVGQLGNVIAVASLVIGAFVLDERYAAWSLLGACMVLAGVALVQRVSRPAGS